MTSQFDTDVMHLIQCIYDANTVIAEGFELGDQYRKLSISDKARDGYRVAFKAADAARRATAELARILDIKLEEPVAPECATSDNKRPALSLVTLSTSSSGDDLPG